MYFIMPSGEALRAHPERAFPWGYGHMVVFGALAALGAGLHLAAYFLERHTEIGAVGTVLSLALPLGVFTVALCAVWTALMRQRDPFHLGRMVGTAGVLVLAVVLAEAGVSMAWCLVVLSMGRRSCVTLQGWKGTSRTRPWVARFSYCWLASLRARL